MVLAGIRILDVLTDATQRIRAVENLLFATGVVPNITSLPTVVSSPEVVPGRFGLDAMGNVRVEPLAGKAVLVAGRDILLELHRIVERLNRTEAAISACPCLAPPATCHPVGCKRNKKKG